MTHGKAQLVIMSSAEVGYRFPTEWGPYNVSRRRLFRDLQGRVRGFHYVELRPWVSRVAPEGQPQAGRLELGAEPAQVSAPRWNWVPHRVRLAAVQPSMWGVHTAVGPLSQRREPGECLPCNKSPRRTESRSQECERGDFFV